MQNFSPREGNHWLAPTKEFSFDPGFQNDPGFLPDAWTCLSMFGFANVLVAQNLRLLLSMSYWLVLVQEWPRTFACHVLLTCVLHDWSKWPSQCIDLRAT